MLASKQRSKGQKKELSGRKAIRWALTKPLAHPSGPKVGPAWSRTGNKIRSQKGVSGGGDRGSKWPFTPPRCIYSPSVNKKYVKGVTGFRV